jgi:hypothetical protein
MADLYLDEQDRQRLARFLSQAFRPARVRPGTWSQLVQGTLESLEGEELRALADAYPRLLVVLKVIEQLSPYVRGGGPRISGGSST